MGGNMMVGFIEPDGTKWRMERWTNPLPGFIHNRKFLARDPKHIAEWMEAYLAMKKDWDAHGPKGPFTENMTNVYAPFPAPLVPSEYGIVLIDMEQLTIHSMNGYFQPGTIHGIYLLPPHPNIHGNEELIEEAHWFRDQGRLTLLSDWGNKGLEGIRAEGIRDPEFSRDYTADMSPFKVVVHTDWDDPAGFTALRERARERFGLSKKEERGWDRYKKERIDDPEKEE